MARKSETNRGAGSDARRHCRDKRKVIAERSDTSRVLSVNLAPALRSCFAGNRQEGDAGGTLRQRRRARRYFSTNVAEFRGDTGARSIICRRSGVNANPYDR